MTPSWLLYIFAAIMLVVAAVSAARLAAARPWRGGRGAALADIDVAHLLMAIAMAGMLTGGLQTLPNGAWEVIFALMTAWFGYRVARDAQVSGLRALAGGHCAPHLTHAASMLYMFAAVAMPSHGSGAMAGMGGGPAGTLRYPVLALAFAFLLAGYTVWDLDQISGPGARAHYSLAPARVARTPALAGAVAGATAATPGGLEAGPQEREPHPVPRPADGQGRGVLAPWVAVSCRIAMGATMVFMLMIMI